MKTILKHVGLTLIINSNPLFQMQAAQHPVLMAQLNQAGLLGSNQAQSLSAQQQMPNAMNQQYATQLQNYKLPSLKFGGFIGGLFSGIQGLSAMLRKPLWSISVVVKGTMYILSLGDA